MRYTIRTRRPARLTRVPSIVSAALEAYECGLSISEAWQVIEQRTSCSDATLATARAIFEAAANRSDRRIAA